MAVFMQVNFNRLRCIGWILELFFLDPRFYSLYSTAAMNPANVNPNWQMARSPPQQQPQPHQQATDPQRGYANGQNVASQQASSSGASNTGGRPASTSGQATAGNSAGGGGHPPSMTPQYTLNGAIPTAYAFGTPAALIPGPQQIQSPQTNVPPPMSATYNVMYDPSQQIPPPSQPPTYAHPNQYETQTYFSQQSQQQQQQSQQPPPQTGADTVQQVNYNR